MIRSRLQVILILAALATPLCFAGLEAGTPAPNVAASASPAHRFCFADFGRGLPHAGQWRDGFDIADMNRDGFLDIVHGPPRKGLGWPVVILGNGRGDWATWRGLNFPDLPYDYGDVAVADFNGDGIPDLALGCHLRGLAVLAGDGMGNFWSLGEGLALRSYAAQADDPPFSSKAIAVADWDGDGRPDLIALSEGPALLASSSSREGLNIREGLRVFLNRSGSWQALAPPPGEDRVFGDSIAAADLDGDGRPDLLVSANVLGYRSVLKFNVGSTWNSRELGGLRPNSYVTSVTTGRFSRAGGIDLVVGSLSFEAGAWLSTIQLFRRNSAGGYEARTLRSEATRARITSLSAGDLDGDGELDLAAVSSEGSVYTFAGDGKGGLTEDETIPVSPWRAGCSGYRIRLRDLNHDKRAEIVASFAGEREGLMPGPGCDNGGGIEAWTTLPPQRGKRR